MNAVNARLTALLIFLLTFATYASYATSEVNNAQHVTRLALALAILEEGRVDIDRFADLTIDKAEFGGHTYADKPPGLSLLVLPSVAVTREVLSAMGQVANPARQLELYIRVATTSAVCLFGALAVALVYLVALRLGAGQPGALFAALALGFGTIHFGWSTLLFAHAVSGSLLLLGLTLILWRRNLLAGLALGFCLVVDLTAAPAAIAIGLLSLAFGGWRGMVWLAIGGLAGILPLLIYNALAFGSLFKVGYSEVVGFEGMRTGFLGLGAPNFTVLYEILLGSYRGLLPLSPILVLVPIGLVLMPDRRVALAIAAVIVSFLYINMSYFYWHGGVSTGPRHIVAMLPLAAVALAFAWPRTMWAKVVVVIVLAASITLSLIAVSSTMLAGEQWPSPMYQLMLPMIARGDHVKMIPGLIGIALFVWLMVARLRQPRSATS